MPAGWRTCRCASAWPDSRCGPAPARTSPRPPTGTSRCRSPPTSCCWAATCWTPRSWTCTAGGRVSDVLLRATDDGLEVVGVDLGAAGLLRRLGLGALGAWAGVLEVDWPHLHLTSPRGHLVQLGTDTAPFRQLDAPGLAELPARLSTPRAVDVVRATEPARAAAALHHSHPRTGRRIVQGLTGAEQQGLAADEHARTVRRLGRRVSPVARRRWRRTEGWRLQRPPGGGR